MAIVIGVDIGTTSTKVVAFDESGQVQASADQPYPLIQTLPDMAEEDPKQIYAAVMAGLQAVIATVGAAHVAGISFSAAMHRVIVMDAQDQPLTNVLTWADSRGAAFAKRLKDTAQGRALVAKTGVPIHPMSPLVKLMWLNATQPAVMAQAAHVIGIKDYVLFRWFGEYVQDYSLANATGWFDLFEQTYQPQALALAGLNAAQLPRLVDTDYQLHGMAQAVVEQLGLTAAPPVIIGASDGCLSNLGVGAGTPGTVAVTIGTSGAVRTVIDHPAVAASGRLFTYYLAPGRYVVGGPVNNGGVVWRWARDTIGAGQAYPALTALAKQAPAGANGLLFLPYLGGERAPLWDADARGSFIGLTRQHDTKAMLRAVLEGITMNLATVLQQVSAVAGQPTVIHATGGFARSDLWRQLLADIFNTPVAFPVSFESSAFGAAIMGMQALGLIDSLADVVPQVQATLQPDSAHAAVYGELMPLWQAANTRLAAGYAELAAFQRATGKRV